MTRKNQKYGWTKDLPDQRDHLYSAPTPILTALPPSVDMRVHCPAVYDQGQLGSCTGNSIAAGFEFDQIKEKLKHIWVPSRLFIYYNERVIEDTVASDAGAQIRDGIKSVVSQGCCSEDLWPYDISKFADAPPQSCYANAKQNLVTSYQSVAQIANQMKGCLASGYPFVFGFTVYESFESQEVASTGIVPMPASSETVLGGHAVLCVGYDDSDSSFLVRNSWGSGWGLKGYFKIPYQYLLDSNLASDFWVIKTVLGTPAA
jgi:C1A family cysteine protease